MIRYTKKARAVVFYAYEEANRERSKEVTAEHLLGGLLRADESLAARCGLIINGVSEELTKAPRECRTATGLVLSDSARQAILLAAEEREHFGHKHTGTEHLLLGISRGSSDAAKTLEKRGLTINRVRNLVSHRSLAVGSQNVEPVLISISQLP
jgi:ATP-dependent Clp protease ATP-binding subunit ClpC